MDTGMEMKSKRELILVGDKVLLSPDLKTDRTTSGLYLPPTVKEKEKVHGGYVVKTGPGYIFPDQMTEDFPSSSEEKTVKYIPLQAREGDYAIFLKDSSVEIEYEGKKYLIIPHSAILALVRTEIV
jgi:chaperonin GroES